MLNKGPDGGLGVGEARISVRGILRAFDIGTMLSCVQNSDRATLEQFAPAEMFTLGAIFASINAGGKLSQFGPGAATKLATVLTVVESLLEGDDAVQDCLYKAWLVQGGQAQAE